MKIINCCFMCFHGIYLPNGRRDEPPTFFGCMLSKDESFHNQGFGICDCFKNGGVSDKEKRIRVNQFVSGQIGKDVVV